MPGIISSVCIILFSFSFSASAQDSSLDQNYAQYIPAPEYFGQVILYKRFLLPKPHVISAVTR